MKTVQLFLIKVQLSKKKKDYVYYRNTEHKQNIFQNY